MFNPDCQAEPNKTKSELINICSICLIKSGNNMNKLLMGLELRKINKVLNTILKNEVGYDKM